MRKLFFAGSVLAFFGFVAFTYLVKKDLFRQIDFDLAVKIKDNVPLRLDPLFSMASSFGSVFVITFVLLAVLIFLKSSLIHKAFTLFVYFGAQGLELFLKNTLRQPGPPFQFQRHFTDTYFDKDYVQQGYSYPSGHSFRAIFIASLVIAVAYARWGFSVKTLIISAAAASAAAAIMLGKIVLGAHWTTDIIGGGILALSMAFLVISCLPSLRLYGQDPTRERQSK